MEHFHNIMYPLRNLTVMGAFNRHPHNNSNSVLNKSLSVTDFLFCSLITLLTTFMTLQTVICEINIACHKSRSFMDCNALLSSFKFSYVNRIPKVKARTGTPTENLNLVKKDVNSLSLSMYGLLS